MCDRMTDDVSDSVDGTRVSKSNSPVSEYAPVPGTSKGTDKEQNVKANDPKRRKGKTFRKTFPKGWRKRATKRSLATVELSTDEVAAASDEPPVKTKPQAAPNQSQKPSTSQATNTTTSTSVEVEAQKRTDPKLPYRHEPVASTSAGFSRDRPGSSFWIEAVESTFKNSEYRQLLENTQFTKEQTDIIQQSFHVISRKMLNVIRNSDRITKTHKCMDCDFSVSHQCVSLNLIRCGPFNVEITQPTDIFAEKTFICICQFALYHVHATRRRYNPPAESVLMTLTPRFRALKHTMELRCPKCDTEIIIEHRQTKNLCYKFTPWNRLATRAHKKFHNELGIHIQNAAAKALSLEDLYNCENQCCLIFHRCVEPPADLGMLI